MVHTPACIQLAAAVAELAMVSVAESNMKLVAVVAEVWLRWPDSLETAGSEVLPQNTQRYLDRTVAAESAVVAVAFAVAGTVVVEAVVGRERRRTEHWSPVGYLLDVRRGEMHPLAAAAGVVVAV